MERWAANTLRTLGIILTAGFVIVTSLILILLSMCATQSFGDASHPGAGAPYIVGAIIVVIAGVWFITWLARGIFRSSRVLEPTAEALELSALQDRPATPRVERPEPALPLHLSPQGWAAIHRMALALGAQIVLSAVALTFNQLHFWSGPRIFAPFPLRNWGLALFGPFALYHLPYAVLIYVLLKRPDRRAFTYSLAVPAILIMQSLLSLGYFSLFARQHPVAMIVLFVPWAIHIIIVILAYQAIQKVGLHPEPSSIMVAALVTFAFFSFIHVITPFLYRFMWR